MSLHTQLNPIAGLTIKCLLGSLWLAINSLNLQAEVINYRYQLVNSYPHSRDVFTQGLLYHAGKLYESAGQYGESRVLTRTLSKVEPLQEHPLPQKYFAEGIALLDNKLYQLTWRSGRGFIYQAESLEPIGEFRINGQGWGLTHNGHELITSNGSNRLQFLDPATLKPTRSLLVTYKGKAITQLNELEWVEGYILANVWKTPWIVIIDPKSGLVVGKLNLRGLLPDTLRDKKTDVLNGIAYDAEQKRLFVTGKYWPRLYEIALQPALATFMD